MTTCHNCGRVNDESMRICRFCGTVLERAPAKPKTEVRDYSTPFGVGTDVGSAPQTVAPYSPPSVAGDYHCPNCGTTYPPLREKRISSQGWLVFIIFLVLCLPLSVIGLFMKEELQVCPLCRARIA